MNENTRTYEDHIDEAELLIERCHDGDLTTDGLAMLAQVEATLALVKLLQREFDHREKTEERDRMLALYSQ